MTDQVGQATDPSYFTQFSERHHFWTPALARIVLAVYVLGFLVVPVLAGLRGLSVVSRYERWAHMASQWALLDHITRKGSFIAAFKGNYTYPRPTLVPGESELAMKIHFTFYAFWGCDLGALHLFISNLSQITYKLLTKKPIKLKLHRLSLVLCVAAIAGAVVLDRCNKRLLQDWAKLGIPFSTDDKSV